MTGQTATGGSVRGRPRGILGGSRTGWAPIAVLAAASAAGLLLAIGPASAQTITSKRAQAEAILAEVESLNGNLEQTIEAYNYANIELDRIESDLASNAKHLVAAKKSLVVAQARIAERLRDLYVNGEGDSTLEVILGSSSLDDIIARLDAIERVSSQDTHILRTVKQYRKEVETRRSNLQDARADQAQIVAEQAAQKQSIESQIAEQNQLLDSVKDEIAEMRAEEARRQAALAAQARAQAQAAELAALAQPDIAQTSYEQPWVDALTTIRTLPLHGTATSSASRCSTSGSRTCGAARARRRDSIARVHELCLRTGRRLAPAPRGLQYGYGTPVSYDQLAAGDLVFFSGLGHVGSTSATVSSSTRRTPAMS